MTDDGALNYLVETSHFTQENSTEKKRKLKRGGKKDNCRGDKESPELRRDKMGVRVDLCSQTHQSLSPYSPEEAEG